MVESVKGFFRNTDRGNNINNFINSSSFFSKFSEENVKSGLDTIPSGEFSGEIFFSNGEVSSSLLSESFGVSDVLDALFKGGSVLDESLSGIINSGLGDSHEFGVSRKLVSFSLLGIDDTLNEFSSDGSEFGSKSIEHIGIGEIGEFEEGLDHGTEFGVLQSFTDLLERSLDFGDLDQRGSSGVETVKELHALIDGINGGIGFNDVVGVIGGVGGSLGGSSVHIGKSVDDKLLISGNLGFEGSFEWVEDVVKRRGSLGNVRFGGGNSVSDGSFPFVMLSKLNVVVLCIDINLELVVSHEILEGLEEVGNW